MKIELTIGPKRVTISTYENFDREEADMAWPEVMKELVFPALKGFGYEFYDEFVEHLGEIHGDYRP